MPALPAAGPQPGAGPWAGSWTTSVYRTSVTGRSNVPAGGPGDLRREPHQLPGRTGDVRGLAARHAHPGQEGNVHGLPRPGAPGVRPAAGGPLAATGRHCSSAKSVLDAGRCVGILPEGTRGSGAGRRHQQRGRLAGAELRRHRGPRGHPGHQGRRRTPGHRSRPGGGSTSASAEPSTSAAGPARPGRVSMDRAGTEIRAALARHVQDAIQRTGQPLPHAESPHERHEAVAGTPADHH